MGQPFSRSAFCPSLFIVQDDPTLRCALALQLGSTFQVTAVESAREALALIARGASFDVALCEARLPEIDGVQFCERLAAAEERLARRVVLMSSRNSTERLQRALERLPNPRIDAPFEFEALAALLEQHARRAESFESTAGAERPRQRTS
jgi:CheY-like chemotaxis protein